MGGGVSCPDTLEYDVAKGLMGDIFDEEAFYELCTRSMPYTITKAQFATLVRNRNGKVVYWEYIPERGNAGVDLWKRFPAADQVSIEISYNDSARSEEVIDVGGKTFLIDYKSMLRTDQASGQSTPIRRMEVRWSYTSRCAESGRWVEYDGESIEKLEDAFFKRAIGPSNVNLELYGYKCFIDWDKMTNKNLFLKRIYTIKREQWFVESSQPKPMLWECRLDQGWVVLDDDTSTLLEKISRAPFEEKNRSSSVINFKHGDCNYKVDWNTMRAIDTQWGFAHFLRRKGDESPPEAAVSRDEIVGIPASAAGPTAAPPAPSKPSNSATTDTDTIRFRLPEGCIPGTLLPVTANGRALTVVVPPGAVAGNLLEISLPKVAARPTRGAQWEYEAEGGTWTRYTKTQEQRLEENYASGKFVALTIGGRQYYVDWASMSQLNMDTNVSRKIRRVGGADGAPESKESTSDMSSKDLALGVGLTVAGAAVAAALNPDDAAAVVGAAAELAGAAVAAAPGVANDAANLAGAAVAAAPGVANDAANLAGAAMDAAPGVANDAANLAGAAAAAAVDATPGVANEAANLAGAAAAAAVDAAPGVVGVASGVANEAIGLAGAAVDADPGVANAAAAAAGAVADAAPGVAAGAGRMLMRAVSFAGDLADDEMVQIAGGAVAGLLAVAVSIPLLGGIAKALGCVISESYHAKYNKLAAKALSSRCQELAVILQDMFKSVDSLTPSLEMEVKRLLPVLDRAQALMTKFGKKSYIARLLCGSTDQKNLGQVDKEITDIVQSIGLSLGIQAVSMQKQSFDQLDSATAMILSETANGTKAIDPSSPSLKSIADSFGLEVADLSNQLKMDLDSIKADVKELRSLIESKMDAIVAFAGSTKAESTQGASLYPPENPVQFWNGFFDTKEITPIEFILFF
jgi:hypothetical protein